MTAEKSAQLMLHSLPSTVIIPLRKAVTTDVPDSAIPFGRGVMPDHAVNRTLDDYLVAGVQVATGLQRYATGYGFGWWIGQASGNEFAFAHGYGGQFIFVVPRTRLVVAATSRWQGIGSAAANTQWSTLIDIIVQRIVPAF